MKFAVMFVLAVLLVSGVGYMTMESAAKEHHPLLKPAAQGQEGSRGSIVAFKTTRYEPNGGSAKAYAVVEVLDGKKTYRLGRLYIYKSKPGEEKWTIQSRKTLWDESKGESAPLITPYWAVR